MFILGLTLFTCFFVGNLYCQDSTKYVIELEKINVDHPSLGTVKNFVFLNNLG